MAANEADEVVPLAQIERRYVHRVLALLGGNKSRAAEVLGIDRRTLHRKLGRWDEDGAADRPTPSDDAPDTRSRAPSSP